MYICSTSFKKKLCFVELLRKKMLYKYIYFPRSFMGFSFFTLLTSENNYFPKINLSPVNSFYCSFVFYSRFIWNSYLCKQ